MCCSEALYKCGTSYFCEECHDDGDGELYDCGGVDCPLGVPHPPASHNALKAMYPLGCSLCRVKPEKAFQGVDDVAIAEI